jgi:elongation factor Tu
MIMPGEHGDVKIILLNKMIMDIGQPFTIRENERTVATGIITKFLSNVIVTKNNLSKVNFEQKISENS